MAIQQEQKDKLLLLKGLVTEASPFLFPPDASTAEENFDLIYNTFRRERRLGIDYEDNYVKYDSELGDSEFESLGISTFEWHNVAGDSTVSIGIFQLGNRLYFIDLHDETPSSAFLNQGTRLTITESAGYERYQYAEINGNLIIATGDSAPAKIEYDIENDVMSYSLIHLKIRDLYGVEDSLDIDEHPTILSDEHQYNLMNQGWTSTGGDKVVPEGDIVYFYDTSTGLGQHFECIQSHTSDATNRPLTGTGTWQDYWKFVAADPDAAAWQAGVSYTSTADAEAHFVDQPITSRYLSEQVDKYFNKYEYYPSNADLWHLGKYTKAKTGEERWSAKQLGFQGIGTTPAPKGRFIIDAFDRGADRYFIEDGEIVYPSFQGGDVIDRELGRPTTVCTYANRVFYSGIRSKVLGGDNRSPNYNGMVFFTQTIDKCPCYAKCYQDADPTSEHISDLVATDGGGIQIAGTSYIYKIMAFGKSILVFAENGVWALTSPETGFTATDYEVNKITDSGPLSAESIVETEDSVYYWSKVGIIRLAIDSVSGSVSFNNMTDASIKTFYDALSSVAKHSGYGFYDYLAKRITWAYNDDSGYDGITFKYKYNKLLHYDIRADAWLPWNVATGTDYPFISATIRLPDFNTLLVDDDVIVGPDQVMVGTDQVIVKNTKLAKGTSSIMYLTFVKNTNTYWATLSHFKNTTFRDWDTELTTGDDAAAFMTTGYDLFNSPAVYKQVPLIYFYLKQTDSISGGGIASSCRYQTRWDGTNLNSNRWSRVLQAYKLRSIYTDVDNYPEDLIVTKDIVKGFGKALGLYISTEAGKDCKLYGWSTTLHSNANPS